MSHTFINQFHHCVFSTKYRKPHLTSTIQNRLIPYIGGIAKTYKIKLIAAGGTEDHVHLLISIPATISLAKSLQLIKGNSSKWIHETFSDQSDFAWQEGYGAFSISADDIERTVKYIKNQHSHHAKMDFKSEFIAFLRKNGMEYDEKYVFD